MECSPQRGQIFVEVSFVVAIIALMLVAMVKFHKGKMQVIEKDMQIKDMNIYKNKRRA
jgi:hypothetical protein